MKDFFIYLAILSGSTYLIRALPFGDHREELLFGKFAAVTRATVKGSCAGR